MLQRVVLVTAGGGAEKLFYWLGNKGVTCVLVGLFSDNVMADVASKQQKTALFLSTTVARTRRHIELTKPDVEICAVPENNQFSFSYSFFTQLNCTV